MLEAASGGCDWSPDRKGEVPQHKNILLDNFEPKLRVFFFNHANQDFHHVKT